MCRYVPKGICFQGLIDMQFCIVELYTIEVVNEIDNANL